MRAFLLLSVLLPILSAGCDQDPPPPPPAAAPLLQPDPAALHVAGTGAMGPLAMRLSLLFAERGGTPRVVVEESIGSGGGVRAAAEGAVDLGMVSRPLSEKERRLPLVLLPVGRDAVVLAAHAGVSVVGVSSAELAALYAGKGHSFADGTPATVLLRDGKESANQALERAVPALTPLREEAYRSRRLRVLYHDSAMAAALASTPGAIGVSSLSAVLTFRLPLKLLALDGVTPSLASLRDGSWRATRGLFFVARPDRLGRARSFLTFVFSPEARRLAAESGYLLPDRPPPSGRP
jgi:phosphate transport system substrate-binding protein